MFQGLLENLLKSLIGEYVEEIDSNKLNLSVSKPCQVPRSIVYLTVFNQ